jgi:hypothetical protein
VRAHGQPARMSKRTDRVLRYIDVAPSCPRLMQVIAEEWRAGLNISGAILADGDVGYNTDYGPIHTNVEPNDPAWEDKVLAQFRMFAARARSDERALD